MKPLDLRNQAVKEAYIQYLQQREKQQCKQLIGHMHNLEE